MAAADGAITLSWLTQVEGLSLYQAIDIIDNWDGRVVERSATRDAEDDARRTAYAMRWWDTAIAIKGTLAARYLTETQRHRSRRSAR